jgi:superfamily II DNA/RNA helicase
MYVGVTTAGRSAKFVLQATAASALQSGSEHVGFSDEVRDGYATLLCYFNSLKELGGAIVQMLDDVPDAIFQYSSRRKEIARIVTDPKELTSRVSQRQIIEILSDLKRGASYQDYVDVVLATNMVSVGVDVPRLGLMLVNGQPKTRSEYIQSTSRVGRSSFPGLVVSVLNAAKARDRSHFETFPAWHGAIYRDVEATSVTPFASRARDRALQAVMVAMIRHGSPEMNKQPNLDNATSEFLQTVTEEIERRVSSVDIRERDETSKEIDENLDNWETRNPKYYLNPFNQDKSLLQFAEDYAKKIAAGKLPGEAWPVMNTMRSLEPSTRFRMAEYLSSKPFKSYNDNNDPNNPLNDVKDQTPRWRKKNA